MTYFQHGRRHHPIHGTDPIVGLTSAVKQWPIEQQIPILTSSTVAAARPAVGFGYVDTATAVAVPNGAVYNNYKDTSNGATTTRTAALGDYFIVCSRIGPEKAQFWWDFGIIRGTDYGIFSMSVAMLQEAADGSVDDPATATYYPAVDPAFYEDAYNSTANWRAISASWEGTWDGEDGDVLTGVTTSGAAPRYTAHGGPGLYAFKFEVVDKSVSSSGYKLGFWGVSLQRSDQAGGFGL